MSLINTLKALPFSFGLLKSKADSENSPKKNKGSADRKSFNFPKLNLDRFKFKPSHDAEQEMAEIFGLPQPKKQLSGLPLFLLIGGIAVVIVYVSMWLILGNEDSGKGERIEQPRAVINLSTKSIQDGSEKTDEPISVNDENKPKTYGRRIQRPVNSRPKLEKTLEPTAHNTERKPTLELQPHPDPGIIENNALGPLPIIGEGSRKSWKVYSRPFDQTDTRPRISIVFVGLGVSAIATKTVLKKIPGSVSLAFAPHSRGLKDWISASRAAGHEVLVDLPMEPFEYPRNDPGPYTLLTTLPEDQNKYRLHWVLSRFTGYVGVSTFMGSKFATQPNKLRPIIRELKMRGLMLLDVRENPLSSAASIADGLTTPSVTRDYFIDDTLTQKGIRARLVQAEKLAKSRGYAVAIARPYPLSIVEIKRWTDQAEDRGLALAPISAILQMRKR